MRTRGKKAWHAWGRAWGCGCSQGASRSLGAGPEGEGERCSGREDGVGDHQPAAGEETLEDPVVPGDPAGCKVLGGGG